MCQGTDKAVNMIKITCVSKEEKAGFKFSLIMKGMSDSTSNGRFFGLSHLIQSKDTIFTINTSFFNLMKKINLSIIDALRLMLTMIWIKSSINSTKQSD